MPGFIEHLKEYFNGDRLVIMHDIEHPGNLCLSIGTEDKNLVVIEYGDTIISGREDKYYLKVKTINDCIGYDKSSIEEFIGQLERGVFENVKSTFVIQEPKRISEQELYWARILIELKFKGVESGTLTFTQALGLEGIGALIINEGREYGLYESKKDLRHYSDWSDLKSSLYNEKIFVKVKARRIRLEKIRDLEKQQIGMICLLPGIAESFGFGTAKRVYVKPEFIEEVYTAIKILFLDRRPIPSSVCRMITQLLKLGLQDFILYETLYEKGYLRAGRISQKYSLKSFFRNVVQYDNPLNKYFRKYNTLRYHVRKIQETLEIIEKYITSKAGLEAEILHIIASGVEELWDC